MVVDTQVKITSPLCSIGNSQIRMQDKSPNEGNYANFINSIHWLQSLDFNLT